MLKINNKKIVSEVALCKTHAQKARGLMFTLSIKDKALVFIEKKEKFIPLHMFFVFYPIDMLWLNKEKEVVSIQERAKPFFPHYMNDKKAMYVIELPASTIKNYDIKLGQKCSW